ncbi:MAG: phage holin family protein [Isosphaeraceae bacterium]
MALAHDTKQKGDLIEKIEPVAHDLERLSQLHVDLLKSELRQSVATATPALAEVGLGSGLVVTGGVLGLVAAVHALQRSTRIPLWACYGLVGGILGSAGWVLVRSGARRVSEVSFVPRETLATLRDDYAWLREATR